MPRSYVLCWKISMTNCRHGKIGFSNQARHYMEKKTSLILNQLYASVQVFQRGIKSRMLSSEEISGRKCLQAKYLSKPFKSGPNQMAMYLKPSKQLSQ